MLSSMLFALITLWWGFFGIFARCFLTALQQCNVFCSKLCWWAALSLSHFIVTVNTLDASVEKKEEKKRNLPDLTSAAPLKKMSHGMSLSAASDAPWYRDIVSSGFLPKRCHSTSAIVNQSENSSLQEKAIRRSLCTAFFLHGVQWAKADNTTWAPGATRQIGPREECETLGCENNWTFGDVCCLFAVWDWRRQLLMEGGRWGM